VISNTDAAYIAGLFDGEGSITYKQYMRKRKHQKKAYPTWSIRMEIAMTDKSVLVWVHEILGVGTLNPKRYRTKYTVGWKKQWRWRCQHRDAYFVSCLFWPYAHVKLDKIQKIIDHYGDHKIMNGNVVDLEKYKKIMSLE
tara:strand:- start:350 stop:769 length:420 start_codon:yes stop_codon:yes gene_type:complete